MRSREFPACCGITLLSDFGNTILAYDSTAYKQDEVIAFLEQAADNNREQAMLVASLNNFQFAKIGHAFRECGWKCVSEGKNTSHGTTVHLMVKILNPVE